LIIIAWLSIVVVGCFNCFAPHTSSRIIGVFLDRIHNMAAKRALDSDHQNVRICSYQLVILIKAKGVRKRKRKR
jgi:hypothetical protein